MGYELLYHWARCLTSRDTKRNKREKRGWTLTFEDDFETGALDTNKWYDGPSFGQRYYECSSQNFFSPNPNNFAFTASTIKLITDKQPTAIPANSKCTTPFTIPYTAGMIETVSPAASPQFQPFEQLYGYFEIRCKIPDTPKQWPAFWLATRASWPPEIDIFEFYTKHKTRKFESTQHNTWAGRGHPHGDYRRKRTHLVCKPANYFHIYACEWSSTDIRWYLDNHLIRVSTKDLWEFVHPMFVIINSAVDEHHGDPSGSTYPNYFEVDYVRVYQRP